MGNAPRATRQMRQDMAPGRIGQSGERPIQIIGGIFNHLVKYLAHRFHNATKFNAQFRRHRFAGRSHFHAIGQNKFARRRDALGVVACPAIVVPGRDCTCYADGALADRKSKTARIRDLGNGRPQSCFYSYPGTLRREHNPLAASFRALPEIVRALGAGSHNSRVQHGIH